MKKAPIQRVCYHCGLQIFRDRALEELEKCPACGRPLGAQLDEEALARMFIERGGDQSDQ